MSTQFTLVCRKCGHALAEEHFFLVCPRCSAPMRVLPDPDLWRHMEWSTPQSDERCSFLQQWRTLLPIAEPALIDAVSLGEFESSLLPSRRYGPARGIDALYFKLEMGPTLSLKDRGTSLCMLKALEMGYKTVCVSSSGNNAASVSAYAARAGLNALVFVQKQVSPAKILKSLVYGGRVVRVDGDMAAASRLCSEMLESRRWFQCGGPNPYRLCAKRTVAFGITRQLGRAPDTVLMPCGGGAGLVAMYDGFSELLEAGFIDRMPRLVGVQLDACNPTAQAFHKGETVVTPVEKKTSLSDAIMNNAPYWGEYCLQAVRQSGGTMISISDEEFVRAILQLGREEGLFTEPAGAVSAAALAKLVKVPGFETPGLTVCTLTGHGLNSPQVVTREEDMPELVSPTPQAVDAYLAKI